MIFSLFRNGKETLNKDYFRVDVTEECAHNLMHFIEREIWERFMHRHVEIGGIIHNKAEFVRDAISLGYSVGPVDS